MKNAKQKLDLSKVPQYNTRHRPGGSSSTFVGATCTCGLCFAESFDYSREIIYMTDIDNETGQLVQMECPKCGRLCWAHPKKGGFELI